MYRCIVVWSLIYLLSPLKAYEYGPDSKKQEGVPEGNVEAFVHVSKIFGEATRDYWVYTPAGYDAAKALPYMIFQDGRGFVKGSWKATVILDNLIHQKKIPAMIAIFINPGELKDKSGKTIRWNRSKEYDAVNDQYSRFLLEELLPVVRGKYKLTDDPNKVAIAGSSSGGICAFTAAWERPDKFRRVATFVGSYTNLRGGQDYPSLIRKTEPKPLKIFMQSGKNDQSIYSGSWPIGNLDVADALKFAGYDFKHVIGTEGHNNKHGRAILPEVLTWLWDDSEEKITKNMDTKQPIMKVLDPEEEWQLVSEGYEVSEGPAVDPEGNVYFTDIPNSKIYKIDTESWKVSLFKENTGRANGLMFGPDGKLYACASGKKKIIAYDVKTGEEETVAEGFTSNDLVVTHNGDLYVTEPRTKKIWFLQKGQKARVVAEGVTGVNGVILNTAQNLLIATDFSGHYLYSFRIDEDGSLSAREKFYILQRHGQNSRTRADGMAVDVEGRLYVATELGIQMCDRAGRVQGILTQPHRAHLTNIVFGGKNLDIMIITNWDKVYRRKVKTKGFRYTDKPFELKRPRL